MSISPAIAAQAAERGLQKIDLNNNPEVAAAYAGGHAGVPLLVTRVDEPDRDYYLVPWLDQRGVVLVAQVDGSSGEMSSAAVLPTPMPSIVMSPDEARRIVASRLALRITGEPKLVWRPSHESASPLQPLYHIPVEGGEAFVGVDGSVYRRLTPFGKGG
ncbi:MAG TPA: hypothetical protein VLM38_06895 [Blastocatellia bacterium]|nr:hypothetical protein [Blastocatellia bacterium]